MYTRTVLHGQSKPVFKYRFLTMHHASYHEEPPALRRPIAGHDYVRDKKQEQKSMKGNCKQFAYYSIAVGEQYY